MGPADVEASSITLQGTRGRYPVPMATRPSTALSRTTGPVAYIVIVGGFAASMIIARPFLQRTKNASRNAECLTNLEVIADGLSKNPGALTSCGPWPATIPTEAAQSWADQPDCFTALGFDPVVSLWGRYELRREGTGWLARCELDLDGDGETVVYQASDRLTADKVAGTED